MRLILHHVILAILMVPLVAACSKQEEFRPKQKAPSDELRGEALFSERCRDCHRIRKKGGEVGPDLSGIGQRRNRRFVEQVIRDPSRVFPGSVMPQYKNLSVRQVNSLVAFLIVSDDGSK